ncbi:MAG: hypothetical protein ACI9SP_001865 [Arenicella sp.]|jgi:hypothetical protein
MRKIVLGLSAFVIWLGVGLSGAYANESEATSNEPVTTASQPVAPANELQGAADPGLRCDCLVCGNCVSIAGAPASNCIGSVLGRRADGHSACWKGCMADSNVGGVAYCSADQCNDYCPP